MATLVKSPIEVVDRRVVLQSVLASFGMEGLEPDAETTELLEQYATGSLSMEQLGAAIERHVVGMGTEEIPV